MLTAYKPIIYSDATSLIVFKGPANVAVSWSIASGPGTIEPLSSATDDQGVAGAVYHADGTTGDAVVRCQHGT